MAQVDERCRLVDLRSISFRFQRRRMMERQTASAGTMIVIYAIDIEATASFYASTLGMSYLQSDPGFIVLGDRTTEIAIVRMSAQAAVSINDLSGTVREDTAMKPSFLVDDLERVADAARSAGGGVKPAAAAWDWRGQRHLDGHDPEGNVVQFRQALT